MVRFLFAALVILLCSCGRYPESYAPPAQFQPGAGPSPNVIVDFADPEATEHIVKDIDAHVHGSWVWTAQRPTVKLMTLSNQNVKLMVDFTLSDQTFLQTGPVELTFQVNDRNLDKVRYDAPGHKHFEKPVPSDWLTAEKEATVSVAIDKLYAGDDGSRFGFILSRIGFTR